jgi:hypothetical protein
LKNFSLEQPNVRTQTGVSVTIGEQRSPWRHSGSANRGSLSRQLQQYPQFVGTAPALDDLAVLEPRNLHSAGSDVPTGGRDPKELAVMGAVKRVGDSNVSLVLHEPIDRHR